MPCEYSVIIPVYNAEKTLQRCLDSIIRQNWCSTEIILVNDGSKDQSGEICRSYAAKHKNIIYIEQENFGASAARNAGLDVAKGKYITFVDSDDYALDGYFSTLCKSDDDFIAFSYQSIRPHGISIHQFKKDLIHANSNFDRIVKVIGNRIPAPWNKRFKKSIIEQNHIRFRNDLVIGEDFIFGLEYMLHCRTSCIINEQLYCVDETDMRSITRSAKYDYMQFIKIYQYAFQVANDSEWIDSEKRKLIQQLDYLYCRTAFACAKHVVEAGNRAKLDVAEFVRLFSQYCQSNIKAMNGVHAFMKTCIRHECIPIFNLVTKIYMRVWKRSEK